jgi:hypothetical protein
VDRSSPDIETDMIDLTDASFAELRAKESELLSPWLRLLLEQIERHRVNLGGNGPPGRVD